MICLLALASLQLTEKGLILIHSPALLTSDKYFDDLMRALQSKVIVFWCSYKNKLLIIVETISRSCKEYTVIYLFIWNRKKTVFLTWKHTTSKYAILLWVWFMAHFLMNLLSSTGNFKTQIPECNQLQEESFFSNIVWLSLTKALCHPGFTPSLLKPMFPPAALQFPFHSPLCISQLGLLFD